MLRNLWILIVSSIYFVLVDATAATGKALQCDPHPKWPNSGTPLDLGIAAPTNLLPENTYRICSIDAQAHWPNERPIGQDGISVFGENGKFHVLTPDLSCVDVTGHEKLFSYLICHDGNNTPEKAKALAAAPNGACQFSDKLACARGWYSNVDVLENQVSNFSNGFTFQGGSITYFMDNYAVIERPTPAKYAICIVSISGKPEVEYKSSTNGEYKKVKISGCDVLTLTSLRVGGGLIRGTYKWLK